MAELVAVIASTHHPFYYRASTATGADRPPFADEWVRKIEAFRETLTRPAPTCWSWSAPTTSTSSGWTTCRSSWSARPRSTTRTSTTRNASSGCRGCCSRGTRTCRRTCCATGLDAGFDLAFSNELRIDHSITCPIITLRPQADLPIVPDLHQHLRPAAAAAEAVRRSSGRTIREVIESWPSDQRVAVIGTGHLSLELGGPRQFGPTRARPGVRPEGRRAGSPAATSRSCLAEVSLDSLHLPGNATHGFMDFMLMMGVAGEGRKADYVDTLDLFHTMEAYFTWYPNGAPA